MGTLPYAPGAGGGAGLRRTVGTIQYALGRDANRKPNEAYHIYQYECIKKKRVSGIPLILGKVFFLTGGNSPRVSPDFFLKIFTDGNSPRVKILEKTHFHGWEFTKGKN